jgi:hypothetical protein
VNNRTTPRHGVLRQGQIVIDERTIYCAIRDLSSGGARIEVGVPLPPEFYFILSGYKSRLRAELRWQKGNLAGIAFQETLASHEVEAAKKRERLIPRPRQAECSA